MLRSLFVGKVSPRLQYAIWLLVAVRLLMPLTLPHSPVSVLNMVTSGKHTEGTGNLALPAQPGLVTETDPGDVGTPTDVANNTGTTDQAAQENTAALNGAASSGSLSGALHTTSCSRALRISPSRLGLNCTEPTTMKTQTRPEATGGTRCSSLCVMPPLGRIRRIWKTNPYVTITLGRLC